MKKTDTRLLELVALALLVFGGLLIRFDDLYLWHQQSEKVFLHGSTPVLTTSDGYYYLRLAKELDDSTAPSDKDWKRAYPDSPESRSIPPLLSVVTYLLYKVTGFPLTWIAVVLPALLALVIAIPLFAIGKHFGGPIMALASVAMGVTSNAYLYRTSLGRYDTDCLNAFFPLLISFLVLKFSETAGGKRYLYLGGWLFSYLLFLWWWDQVPLVVTCISLVPLLLTFRVHFSSNAIKVFIASLLLLLLGYLFGKDEMLSLWDRGVGLYAYIAQKTDPLFPQIGGTITEQNWLSSAQLVNVATNSTLIFGLSVMGIFLLALARARQILFFIIPICLSLGAVFYAQRFVIFLAPMLALGFGYSTELICNFCKRRFGALMIFLVLVIFMMWQSYIFSREAAQISPFSLETIRGLKTIAHTTPDNSVVWSSCDNGYLVSYWAERSSICDGQYHGGEISVYNAIPLATKDFRLAANFISFFSEHGVEGIHQIYRAFGKSHQKAFSFLKKILAQGPQNCSEMLLELMGIDKEQSIEEWKAFFFPANQQPLYFFVDWRMILEEKWIYPYGTWNIAEHAGEDPLPSVFYLDSWRKGAFIEDRKAGIRFDVTKGEVTQRDSSKIPIVHASLYNPDKEFYSYRNNGGVEVDAVTKGRIEGAKSKTRKVTGQYSFYFDGQNSFAQLMDTRVSRSVLVQLYRAGASPAPTYFSMVADGAPHYKIWRVMGDSFE